MRTFLSTEMNSEERSQIGEARAAVLELQDRKDQAQRIAALARQDWLRRVEFDLMEMEFEQRELLRQKINVDIQRFAQETGFCEETWEEAERAMVVRRSESHQLFCDLRKELLTSLNGGGGDADAVEKSNGVLLHPLQCSTTRDSRKRGGSQALIIDEGGGRAVSIAIEGQAPPQRSDQAFVAAPRTTTLIRLLQYVMHRRDNASAAGMLVTDDVGVDVPNSVSAIFAGFVVLSFTNLIGTSKGDYPVFIRLGLYAGYVLLIVLSFLGLTSKKMAKPAMRVAAGMSIAAVTISAVYEVSEKMHIKCIIGILGAMGTLAMAVIDWR